MTEQSRRPLNSDSQVAAPEGAVTAGESPLQLSQEPARSIL